jgi:predicted RNase H-like nuclease
MSTTKSFQVAGVDGCKAGWCAAVAEVINKSGRPVADYVLEFKRFFIAPTFAEVLAGTEDCQLVCVDIPIGLSDNDKPRECDVAARKILGGPRASSVFPAPIRPCLSANDYETARRISLERSGKKLNRQSFALLAKILQVDEAMTPELQHRVREIHPEVSFCALNGNRPITQSKKTPPGQAQRSRLLRKVFADFENILARVLARGCAVDDLLDALVAAWTAAQTVMVKARTLPDNPTHDSKGLRMEILYPLTDDSMSLDWADKIVDRLLNEHLIDTGICLVLGSSDTGKTTLVSALAKSAASCRPVAIVDADIGQSHIGPPATVGWTVIDNPQADFSALPLKGISFVGDVSPIGHLLQLTAAISQCVRQAAGAADLIIIDTPGLVLGPAARALWWTVHRTLQPTLVLAVQRGDELAHVLAGLRYLESRLELIKPPADMLLKSPQHRRRYRRDRFARYFRDACLHEISLSKVAVQGDRSLGRTNRLGRLVALRDAEARDMAVGLIEKWKETRDIAVIRAPKTNVRQIRCVVIGDVSIDIDDL